MTKKTESYGIKSIFYRKFKIKKVFHEYITTCCYLKGAVS